MPRPSESLLAIFVSLWLATSVVSQVDLTAELPPAPPWSGKTRSLVVAADDPWITPAEASGFAHTPDEATTTAWLKKLVAKAPELHLVSLGKTGQGRDVWMVIASKDQAFTPEAMRRSQKPILLAQAGIHSGEIDGKDAGLMLLRDLTVKRSRSDLLDKAQFLFIPILNPDGHERSSPKGRINQRGPGSMGWRTNGRNKNLNRDYAKLDTTEIRAVVSVINQWAPDLYLDLHVTDGADYQYDITFGSNGPHGWSPAIATWMEKVLTPHISNDLTAQGHIPGPLIFLLGKDYSQGVGNFTAGTRFSHGYGDARHLPTVLVENHSLKPYDQRVLGTYVLLTSALSLLGNESASLRDAVRKDSTQRPDEVPLAWGWQGAKPTPMKFRGISSEWADSKAAGEKVLAWTGKPIDVDTFYLVNDQVTEKARRPNAYWIPGDWPEVIERLERHGVPLERITESRSIKVTLYRLEDPKLGAASDEGQPFFEGHVTLSAQVREEIHERVYHQGSARVPTNNAYGALVMALLEPRSPDSFLRWGFFHDILQRTEYVEPYVMGPFADRLLAADKALAAAFQSRLAEDEKFRSNPMARLQWIYERSAYVDQEWHLYPVGREE